jgi:protein-tyrosine-phosphatase
MRDELGVDLSGRSAKHLSVFADYRFDQVVTLCDRVREVCPDFPGRPQAAHWSIPDPAAEAVEGDDPTSLAAFRRVAAELEVRVGFLLAALTRPAGPSVPPSPTTAQEQR